MKIAILGPTGFVGKELVRGALKRGLGVKVLARSPEKLGDLASQVEVVHGDLSSSEDLMKVVRGTAAVLSAAGPANSEDQPLLFERAMDDLVSAMDREGVKRLVMISGGGSLTIPGEKKSLRRWFMTAMVKLAAKYVVEAKAREFRVLTKSNLEWISVRAPMIQDRERTNSILANGDRLVGMTVSKNDLVEFMLDQLDGSPWIRKAPFVASPKRN